MNSRELVILFMHIMTSHYLKIAVQLNSNQVIQSDGLTHLTNLKRQEKKMHLKMSSADVVCCK